MAKNEKISEEKARQILEDYKNKDLKFYDIVMKHNISNSTLTRILKRNGIESRKESNKINSELHNEIIQLRKEGYTLEQIAEKVGVHRNTVQKRVSKRNLQLELPFFQKTNTTKCTLQTQIDNINMQLEILFDIVKTLNTR